MSDKYRDDTGEDECDGRNYRPSREPSDPADRMPAGTAVRERGADSDENPRNNGERERRTGHGRKIAGPYDSVHSDSEDDPDEEEISPKAVTFLSRKDSFDDSGYAHDPSESPGEEEGCEPDQGSSDEGLCVEYVHNDGCLK